MIILFDIVAILFTSSVTLWLGLQVIALGDFVKAQFEVPFEFVWDLKRYLEYKEFLILVLFIILLTTGTIIWNTLLSKRAREKRKIKRLSKEEKSRYSHMARLHEAKKGTQRLEFNAQGESLGNKTFRGFFDVTFNSFKIFWNKMCTLFKADDKYKMNVYKNWNIEENESGRRAGIPIITRRNKVWVDAQDSNSLIIGSTRSGKTFGIVHILIQMLRMSKESMVINDVKGELYTTHAQSLRNDGYDVFKVDFINPKKSIKWNPFGVIIKKYRKAYTEWADLIESDEYLETTHNIKAKSVLVTEFIKMSENADDKLKAELNRKIEKLNNEIDTLMDRLPKPDYSEAKEYILDIAHTLCNEKETRDPFWSSSAATLLDGYINFLLEERMEDEYGNYGFLPDEMINMYSVKMLHDLGKSPVTSNTNDGCKTILEQYIKKYRNIDDASSMKLRAYLDAPDNTAGSIASVFEDKIKYFLSNESILSMTSESEFDINQLGDKKTAIFVCVHDEKSTFHSLASILFSQVYEELIKEARDYAERTGTQVQRLKRGVTVVWDEFSNSAKFENITNALSAGLSRNVRFDLIIQDYGQLYNLYGKDRATTIKSNCQNLVFLLANDNQTLEEISKACGTKKIWDQNRNDKIDVPIMSVDSLRNLSMGDAVIIRGRKNPYKTRLLGFDRYNFYKNLPKQEKPDDIRPNKVVYFNILKALQKKIEKNNKENFEIQDGYVNSNNETQTNDKISSAYKVPKAVDLEKDRVAKNIQNQEVESSSIETTDQESYKSSKKTQEAATNILHNKFPISGKGKW